MLQEHGKIVHNISSTKEPDALNKSNGKELNGLRGIMSIHIILHHFFFYSTLNLNLMGAVSNESQQDQAQGGT